MAGELDRWAAARDLVVRETVALVIELGDKKEVDMHIFVTGATGWVGSAVVNELIAAGHQVVGLARSDKGAKALTAAGAEVQRGSLSDLEMLKRAASDADGVIHLAFGIDFTKIVEMAEEDRQAIEAFGEVYAGSNRPVIVTSGFGFLPPGETFIEEMPAAPLMPGFPRASEQTAFAIASKGARATWVRLPRSVHGVGERHGFVPMLAGIAQEKGVSAYVGEGQNLWPSVHRIDAARLYRLALEQGAQGGPFHAVADEGVPFRQIAEAISEQLGVPTKSITPEEAAEHFGLLAMFISGNGPASSAQTRERLGWMPEQPGLIRDINRPEYFRT